MYKQEISDFIDNHKDEMIKHLVELINIPSIRTIPEKDMPYGENNFKALEHACRIAEKMGLETENFENRICIASIDKGEKRLGILTHLDVVDVNADNWDTPPFSATIKDNMIYGRGAYDDKGSAIAALYALYAVKELQIPLKNGVGVYFGTDEECGSGDLAEYLKEHTLPECIFTPDSHFPVGISEQGLIRLIGNCEYKSDSIISVKAGKQTNIIPDGATVKIKNTSADEIKNILSSIDDIGYDISENDGIFTVEIHGKSVHAAYPSGGVNAAVAALKLVSGIDGGMFADLYKLFSVGMYYGEGFGFSKGQLTLSFTVMNYENGQLEFRTDSRVELTQSSEECVKRILDKIPCKTTIECINEPHSVAENSYIVRTLMEIYKSHTGRNDKPYGMAGLTYAHGIPNAVVFGARLPEDGSGGAHSENECFNLDTMIAAAKMFAAAIVEICNSSEK